MALPVNIVTSFEQITRYSLSDYLNAFVAFTERGARSIINLYSGNTRTIDTDAFDQLRELIGQAIVIEGLVEVHKREMASTAAFWELLEMLTDIQTSLDTYTNSRKWLRSSISKSRLEQGVRTEIGLKQFQTLESLSNDIGADDKESYWLKIALDNDLAEEDYSSKGGNKLSVTGANKGGINIASIIDVDITGKKIYGKDICRKISFDNDDIKVLSEDDTLKQNVFILATLKRGDTPEYDQEGIQSSLVNGSNRSSIAYPILLRQYYDTFNQDDSFKSILIKDIELNQDALQITIECETRIGETVEQTVKL